MRLTKRQLKRIIREEYSRLKHRGLINEMEYAEPERGTPHGVPDISSEQVVEALMYIMTSDYIEGEAYNARSVVLQQIANKLTIDNGGQDVAIQDVMEMLALLQ